MIFCKNCVGEDGACCDFCRYYDFNGNEKGYYMGNGHCQKHDKRSDPGDVCDDFYCKAEWKKREQARKDEMVVRETGI